MRNIALLCLSLWQSLIVTFWITFLVNTSESCELGLDCFDQQFQYIEDCATFDFTNNSVQCYQFELDFINGTGTAGGLLAIAIAVIQLSMQVWLKKKIDRSLENVQYRILSTLSVFVPLSVEIVFLGLSVYNFLNSLVRRQSLAILPKYVLSMFYLIPLIQFTTLPLCRKPGLMREEEAGNDEENPGDDDNHSDSDTEVDLFHDRQLRTRFKRYTAF